MFNLTSNQRNPNQNNKMQFLPINLVTFFNDSTQSWWEEAKGAISYIAGGSINWYSLSGKRFGNMLSRPWKLSLPFNPVIPLLGIHLKEIMETQTKISAQWNLL